MDKTPFYKQESYRQITRIICVLFIISVALNIVFFIKYKIIENIITDYFSVSHKTIKKIVDSEEDKLNKTLPRFDLNKSALDINKTIRDLNKTGRLKMP